MDSGESFHDLCTRLGLHDTPLIDIIEEIDRLRTFIVEKDKEIERTKSDCMTLTLRLYGEPLESMSPECIEVMGRWKPLAAKLIGGSDD
jgi:hypothetical protein